MSIEFINTYADLGDLFCQSISPESSMAPRLILFNDDLAKFLGIRITDEREITKIFSGVKVLQKSHPIAMAYAGHQFGHFVPQLGDGRAILLGEVVANDKKLYDIQLKGAGQTKFSREGDGRSALGPVIREYIISEAMHSLGIPATRALAAMTTGNIVYRQQGGLAGGIFTRVASSHIRIGTFEYFFYRQDFDSLKKLADYTILRHYPSSNYFEFFQAVARRTLKLVAQWMSLGFIHGVMNTDNTSISGETIDFGPCAFIDYFMHDKVFSSIDRQGRYSYSNQGNIALWNLSALANTLTPLVKPEDFVAEFETLSRFFSDMWRECMGKKLGIFKTHPEDSELIQEFLDHLQKNQMDFTNSFRNLHKDLDKEGIYQKVKKRILEQSQSLAEATKLMYSVNPYIIPRNHLVEKAINLAAQNDFSFFETMVDLYKNPYEESDEEFTRPPRPEEVVHQTFCGT